MNMENIKPCREWEEQLLRLEQGTLLPTARKKLEVHLASCPRCRAFLQTQREERALDVLLQHIDKNDLSPAPLLRPWELEALGDSHQATKQPAMAVVEPLPASEHLAKLGKRAYQRGWVEGPEDYLEDALETALQLDDPQEVAIVWIALGRLAQERKDHAEIGRCFRQALAIAREICDEEVEEWLLEALASLPQRGVETYRNAPPRLQQRRVTPLRILCMVASPDNLDTERLDRKQKYLTEALRPLVEYGRATLTWVSGATWNDLRRALVQDSWDVFHFIGSSVIDTSAEEGAIALADGQGGVQVVSAREVGALLAAHASLQLVLLSASDAAPGEPYEPFSRTAATLRATGGPAVFTLPDTAKVPDIQRLTTDLYQAFVQGMPIELVLSRAQQAIRRL